MTKKSVSRAVKKVKSVKSAKSVNWTESLKKSFNFCIEPKRFLPFFVTDLVGVYLAFMLVSSSIFSFTMLSLGFMPAELLYTIAAGIVVFIGWVLSTIFITGAVVYQSWKEKEFGKSWSVSCNMYLTLVAVTVIVALITFITSMLPYIGLVLPFIVTIAFLFVNQFVVLGNSGFRDALENSVKTFRNKIRAVLITWVLTAIFSSIIMLVFSLPLLSTFALFATQYGVEDAFYLTLFYQDTAWLYLEGIILLLGFSISKVFSLKFMTEVYLQLSKKKFLIF
jgi:hypothetical protein